MKRPPKRMPVILARSVAAFNSDVDLDRLELVLELGQLAAAGHQPHELLRGRSRDFSNVPRL